MTCWDNFTSSYHGTTINANAITCITIGCAIRLCHIDKLLVDVKTWIRAGVIRIGWVSAGILRSCYNICGIVVSGIAGAGCNAAGDEDETQD
jgi:hypothetical protein